jgi:phosphoserine phosphatase RsbX
MAVDVTSAPAGADRAVVDWLDWAVEARPRHGEEVSGDAHVVALRPDGVLLAVIDGLGHGPQAATAAEAAAAAVDGHAAEAADEILRRCHAALAGTRGAVLTLVVLRPGDETATWLGVGNVFGSVVRRNNGTVSVKMAPLGNGIVGSSIPPLRPYVLTLQPGDLVVLASDGVPSGFERTINHDRSAVEIAGSVLNEHADPADDAIVLVARYRGAGR